MTYIAIALIVLFLIWLVRQVPKLFDHVDVYPVRDETAEDPTAPGVGKAEE